MLLTILYVLFSFYNCSIALSYHVPIQNVALGFYRKKYQLHILSNKWFLVWISFVCVHSSHAQIDSTRLLKTVEIIENPIRHPHIGGTTQVWDSLDISQSTNQNIAQLLQNKGHIFIKSYGQGSLATSSVRGAAAGHTAVLWNGLPIQSPMLGLLDFALLPTTFVDAVDVQYGGGSALWGSGAIGAVVNLRNENSFSKKSFIESKSQIGSFGQIQQNLRFHLGNARFQSSTRVFYQQAENNFPFRIAADLPKQNQSNAALNQKGIMQSFAYKISNKQSIHAHLWHQITSRELPPTTTQTKSEAKQDDKAIRMALEYKHLTSQSASKVKFGFFDEDIRYQNAATGDDAPSNFKTYMFEADRQWSLKHQQVLYLGTTHILNRASAKGYGSLIPQEYRAGIFISHRIQLASWAIQGSLRQEWFEGKKVPLVPVFGFEKKWASIFGIRGKISRNYRLPTMNDRFWALGGNLNLKAEHGWSSEAGLDFTPKTDYFKLKLSATTFNRHIKNWILWHKAQGQSFWQASNIAEVWSRGLEQRANFFFSKNQNTWNLGLGYDYVRSTNEIKLTNPNIDAGQQLFYVPKHLIKSTLGFTHKKWGLRYLHNFTGNYLGVNGDLAAYNLASFTGHFTWKFKQISINHSFSIDNIWNVDYQVIERRPMPGRAFQMAIFLRINK